MPASPPSGTPPLISQPDLVPDDLVLPFRAELAHAAGRIVRLGPAIDKILAQHAYPEPVSHLLAEALTLTALLGAAIKYDGRFILQTQTDGPVSLLVADFETPGKLRGYASFDADKVAKLSARDAPITKGMLGAGHLAMTIDQGADMQRYQGVVPVEQSGLLGAAHTYFRQSEQLPTLIKLAVAKHQGPKTKAGWKWRSGGLIVQHLSSQGGTLFDAEKRGPDSDFAATQTEEEDNWARAKMLADTTEDHELLDPFLPPERLLYRLFHEERVRVFLATDLLAECRCSRERITKVLQNFPKDELQDMSEKGSTEGKIEVTCEFCNTPYHFKPDEIS